MESEIFSHLWAQLLWPIFRIIVFISFGLVVANCIELLNWTHRLAVVARPLIRMGRLSALTGASFSVAFFSGVSANTMLSEAFEQKKISKKELVLANLFNSLPRFFLHLPTIFFLTLPFIHGAAFIYIGLTFGAAMLQTMGVVIAGRFLLTAGHGSVEIPEKKEISWQQALTRSWQRLKKRIPRILKFLVPVYVLFYVLGQYGFFASLEDLAGKISLLAWLNPQSLSIVVLHVTAEFSAGLAAASILLANNSLDSREVILALLVGNIIAAPVRAIRHQFPYYVGIFTPRLAAELVAVSQVTRATSIIIMGCCYYSLS